jgi:CBS-domain-containing membrane protein
MRRFKVGAVTVIDAEGRPIGMVSDDDLLLKEIDTPAGGRLFENRARRREHDKAAGRTAGQIMTSPALTVTHQTSVREAARLMHVHRIKQLPVIDAASGKIAGTVHQTDLLKVFTRPAADVLADVAQAVIDLGADPRTLTITVEAGVVRLEGRLARRSQITALVETGRRIEGVADLEADLTYDHDDLAAISPFHL